MSSRTFSLYPFVFYFLLCLLSYQLLLFIPTPTNHDNTKYPNIVPLHAIMGGALGAPPTDQGLIAQYTRPAYATLQQMVPMQQQQTPQQHMKDDTTTNAV